MGIFDIFSTSFLFSIAIILLICGGIFTYFSYKIDNQNHKLTSMVNLVSVLAEDLQFVKNQLNKNVNKIQTIHKVNSDLISVSDGGDGENHDEEDDEDDEYDEDEEDEEDEDDEEDDEEGTEEDLNKYPFKNISLINETSHKEFEDLTNNQLFDEIKTIHLENPISFEETNISLSNDKHSDLKVTNNDISFLKNVDLENGETVEDLQGSYKKMSINKLREVIVGKGVVLDASKLKKTEILKMLEIDN